MHLKDTIVNYDIETPLRSSIVYIAVAQDRHKIVCTDKTPFHAVNYHWPDQPGDTGWMRVNDREYAVMDTVMVAVETATNKLFVDKTIPVKHPQAGWIFMVGHVVEDVDSVFNDMLIHTDVELIVNQLNRQALSAGHSACHLASLALNKMLSEYWRKPIPLDSLGHPNFDALAISYSAIKTYGSEDQYRLSKSIRKKGLDTQKVFQEIKTTESAVNAQLQEWLAHPISVNTFPKGEASLCDRREWQCDLSDGRATIPCGGTHLHNLNSVQSIRVNLSVVDDVTFQMKTAVQMAGRN